MRPPLVSFVTWNRLGLTARNLNALLKTTDDFELHIVESNSSDNTWEWIKGLSDPRIIAKTRFASNMGPIYASNYILSKRHKDQYFITVDSDVNIHTSNWISVFLKAFEEFPEVGLLGAVSKEYYDNYNHTAILREKNGMSYIQITKGFIEGCCQCFRPELLSEIGYWSEENCMGDMEITRRIIEFTKYKAGFLPAVEIDQLQSIGCDECTASGWCTLDGKRESCFTVRNDKYRNPQFRNTFGWKYRQCMKEIELGRRTVYCASIHDPESLKNHYYDSKMAEENFQYYASNSN